MRRIGIAWFLCGLSLFAAGQAWATTPPPVPRPAVPDDPVTDALGTMTTDVEKACNFVTFTGLRNSMLGQAAQALARAQVRLARHEQRFPLQKKAREDGKPLDPVHQALVDDVKAWNDYMHAVNGMQFAPEACAPPTRSAYLPGTDILIQIESSLRIEDRFVGNQAGVGVVVIPTDPYFLRFAKRVTVEGFGGSMSAYSGIWRHSLSVNYFEGDTRTSVSEPNGGNDIGYVPGNTALGAGVNFGNTGSSATGSVSLEDYSFTYKAMRQFNLDNGFNWGWGPDPRESYKELGLIFSYGHRTLDYSGHLQRDADPNNIFANIDHELKTNRFMGGVAVSGNRMLGGNWFLHGMADAQLGVMRSTFDTSEVTCFGCGGTPDVSQFGGGKSTFAWSVSAGAGFGYSFTPNLKFIAGVQAEYGNRHILHTRRNPPDGGTDIKTATGGDWGAFARIVFRGGEPRTSD